MSIAHPSILAAQRFLDAVLWGEHLEVWVLLSPAARGAALSVAERNGLDPVAAARGRSETWSDAEKGALLADLVRGLRADLDAVDISCITVDSVEILEHPTESRTVVTLSVPSLLPSTVTLGEGWAAGSIELVRIGPSWFVDRLRSRRIQRP